MKKISVIVPVYNNEKTILEALGSAVNQGVNGLELIVVNDGSTDGSAELIKEFAGSHPEVVFIDQENQGVSAARNAALDAASGEYVGFLDGDDIYTRKALRNMLLLADDCGADLVIGEVCNAGTFSESYHKQSRHMSRSVYISRDDENLVYNFSCCNKLFRRSVIEENGIRFRPIKHAEDGLFLFTYIRCCGTIIGCPRCVYEYRKRLVLDSSSALKSLDSSMLDGAVFAADSIAELLSDAPLSLRTEFTNRVFRVTLINEYYRRLWTLDDSTLERLIGYIEEYRSRVTPEDLEEAMWLSRDLGVSEHFRTKQEIADEPLISVLVPYGHDAEDYAGMLHTLYYQKCPNFEVIADSRYTDMTAEIYRSKENFHLADISGGIKQGEGQGGPAAARRALFSAAKGRLIQFADIPCIYDEAVLRMSSKQLQRSGMQYAELIMKGYRGGHSCPVSEAVTGYDTDRSRIWADKLFLRDAFDEICSCGEPSEGFASLTCLKAEDAYIGVPAESFREKKKRKKDRPADASADSGTDTAEKAADGTQGGEHLSEDMQTAASDGAVEHGSPGSFFEKLRRFIYAVCRAIMPLGKRKVLFISDSRNKLGGDFRPLYGELVSKGFRVYCDFGTPASRRNEGRRRKLRRAYLLATAANIAAEGFHEDLEWSELRQGQDLFAFWRYAGPFTDTGKYKYQKRQKAAAPLYRKATKIIVSGEAVAAECAEATGADISRILPLGLPAAEDPGLSGEAVRKEYDRKYPQLAGKKILLFSLAYRTIGGEKPVYYFNKIRPGETADALGDGYVTVFRWQPELLEALEKRGEKAFDYEEFGGRVLDLSDEDPEELLLICDACVTDYSSQIFDFELLHKPVIYYWYDINSLKLKLGRHCHFEDHVYGNIAYDQDELTEMITKMDLCEEKRASFHSRYMSGCDGRSAEKITKEMEK